jgi:hypothetical protein
VWIAWLGFGCAEECLAPVDISVRDINFRCTVGTFVGGIVAVRRVSFRVGTVVVIEILQPEQRFAKPEVASIQRGTRFARRPFGDPDTDS